MFLSLCRSSLYSSRRSLYSPAVLGRNYAVAKEKLIEVILTQNLKNNVKGDLIKVKKGYARNYLLPRQIALLPTEENRKSLGQTGKIDEIVVERMKKEATLRKRLSKYVLEIKREKVDSAPYSAIDANVLVEKLWKYRRIITKPTQFEFPATTPVLDKFGDFQVSLKIGEGVVPLKVRVVPR